MTDKLRESINTKNIIDIVKKYREVMDCSLTKAHKFVTDYKEYKYSDSRLDDIVKKVTAKKSH